MMDAESRNRAARRIADLIDVLLGIASGNPYRGVRPEDDPERLKLVAMVEDIIAENDTDSPAT